MGINPIRDASRYRPLSQTVGTVIPNPLRRKANRSDLPSNVRSGNCQKGIWPLVPPSLNPSALGRTIFEALRGSSAAQAVYRYAARKRRSYDRNLLSCGLALFQERAELLIELAHIQFTGIEWQNEHLKEGHNFKVHITGKYNNKVKPNSTPQFYLDDTIEQPFIQKMRFLSMGSQNIKQAIMKVLVIIRRIRKKVILSS